MSVTGHIVVVPPPSPSTSPLQLQIVAGSLGALTSSLFLTPMDVIKTRLQVSSCLSGLCFDSSIPCSHPPTTSLQASFNVALNIMRREGVHSLWSGLSASLAMGVPTIAIYMTAYDRLHSHLSSALPAYRQVTPMVAGVLARTAAVFVTSPLELVRTRMFASSHFKGERRVSVMSHVFTGLRVHGVGFLYTGLAINLLRDVPFSAIYWVLLEGIRDVMTEQRRVGGADASVNLISGSLSGMVTAIVTNPLDVVKSRSSMYEKPMSIREAWRETVRSEGWRGLMRGVGPRVMKVAPSCALVITTYDMVKASLYVA